VTESPVVLITGATGGIGRAVALAYAGRGAQLVLVSRSPGLLKDLVQACERRAAPAVSYVADVTDGAAVRAAVELAVEQYGRLDVVVHAAAVVAYGRLTQVPERVWDRTVEVGVRGTSNVAREALRVFEPAGAGSLVIIGSVLGQITAPRMGAYTTAKWAVHGLARVLQQEARRTPGVHVALVSPGGIDTRIYALVARTVLRVVDGHRKNAAVGSANAVMRLGFNLLPGLYDVLVGPLFDRLALGRQPVEDGEGNVFRPSEDTPA
jgi:NAD(P)-dependent dehydrogenase (short-subunit alcohol dehydrogenase family)